jgi:hypothetical protein
MIPELIDRVTASGVILSVDGGKLRGRPAEKLAPFAAELKRHRFDLIAYLSRPKAEPDEWAEPFTSWLNTRCVVSQRFATNIVALYRDFCAWFEDENDAPCDRAGFESLLTQAGFTLTRVHGVVLVWRLALLEDADAIKDMDRS